MKQYLEYTIFITLGKYINIIMINCQIIGKQGGNLNSQCTMGALYSLKACFITLLFIMFFFVFGWDSIQKFREKKTIIIEGSTEYAKDDHPAIIACASVNGQTGWRDPSVTEKVFETICHAADNAKQASNCVDKETFNFSEIINETQDANRNYISQPQWQLYKNLFTGKCFTLNISAAVIGTDIHHPLTIKYAQAANYQYSMVHDPNFFILGPNPETMPRILQIIGPEYGTKLLYLQTIEHIKMSLPDRPCQGSPSYSFTRCIQNSLSNKVGCRQEWDMWSDPETPACTEMGQLKQLYDEGMKIHQLEKKKLASKTGCLLPCRYKEYQIVSILEQGSPPSRILNLVRSTSSVIVKTDHLLYPFSSFLAEFGGALGLFLGFSFLMVWDFLQLTFGLIISKFKWIKPSRRQRLKTI